jgi:3-oxoacyl-[acyl-carrier protein] reductase
MDLGLAGLQAVVVGGSAGIGASVVKALAKEGCSVAFCGRNIDRIESLEAYANELALPVNGRALDITDRPAVDDWFGSLDRLDIVISCVSALSGDWNEAIGTDIQGTINIVEASERRMTSSRAGAITYIGSKASSFATPGFEAYGAAKAAMAHYLKTVSVRLTPLGIRVNVISPGDTFVGDGFWDRIKQNAPAVYEATVASNPMKRLATPEEIASAAVFVSSPRASFVSGANWYVDGGATNHIQY